MLFMYVGSDMERSFEVEPKNVTAYMGDVVMFSCKIGGVPWPSITWLKDDQEISAESTNFVVHVEGILEIRSAQFTDFGRYRCVNWMCAQSHNNNNNNNNNNTREKGKWYSCPWLSRKGMRSLPNTPWSPNKAPLQPLTLCFYLSIFMPAAFCWWP